MQRVAAELGRVLLGLHVERGQGGPVAEDHGGDAVHGRWGGVTAAVFALLLVFYFLSIL